MPATPYGSEFRFDDGTWNGGTSIAAQPDGSFLVVWEGPQAPPPPGEEFTQDYNEVLGRVFAGGVLGAPFVVNTELADPQFDPDAVARPDGGYTVAYASGNDDSLPNTSIASQRFANAGAKVGPEVFEPGNNVYHRNPDLAVFADGRTVVAVTEELNGELQVYAADGTFIREEEFGYTAPVSRVAATALGGDAVLVVWLGLRTFEESLDGTGTWGLYGQVRSALGGGSAPFLIAAQPEEVSEVDPQALLLADGRVAVSWTARSETTGDDIVLTTFDPYSPTLIPPPVRINDVAAGDQFMSDMALLDTGDIAIVWSDTQPRPDEGTGPAIRGQILDGDGVQTGADFVVSERYGFDPSIAAIGDGDFIVAWNSLLRYVDGDADGFPLGYLYERPGTRDGSNPLSVTLAGVPGPNSFYFDTERTTGQDRITDFGADDVFLTSFPLFDRNDDGIITPGRGGVFHVDGPGTTDTVAIGDGISPALRYLGRSDQVEVYALASVRPANAREILLERGAAGDDGDLVSNTFFFDSALGLPGRSVEVYEDITRFGTRDIFVTTTALADGNRDGIIGFGPDRRLDVDPFWSLLMFDPTDRQIAALEYDGTVERDGVDYYVYSRVGSAAGVADLTFG